MTYDKELWRWVAEGKDQWHSLWHGEEIQLHLETTTLQGTLYVTESWSWFIAVDTVALGLLEARQYTISIEI